MKLRKITDHVYFLPPDDVKDRPMLGYVHGDKFALAIDGGFSPDQVDGFYDELEANGLKEPDYTVLTHWHWDHTLGLGAMSGHVICEERTDELIQEENERLRDPEYEQQLRRFYSYVDDEFQDVPVPQIRRAEILFSEKKEMDLGGVTARMFHCEAPHTSDTTLIYIPEDKVLFLGDAPLGDFSNGGYTDRKKLAVLLETIRSLDCNYVLNGHSGLMRKEDLLNSLRAW